MSLRRKTYLGTLAVWAGTMGLVLLPACTPGGAAAATKATSQPVGQTPADAREVLQDLEQAGREYETLRANIAMTVLLPALGDSERRTGWVAYRRATETEPEKIRVHFETLKLGDGPNTRQREDYAFDGHWATEAKHSVKQLTRWQVAAEGERVEALRIGKGAFPPLPFGQKAEEVLEFYHATLAPPAEDDPPNTDHLVLVAHREKRKEVHFHELDLWVDRATHLPVEVSGRDADGNSKTVVLSDMETNPKLKDETFELEPGFGWTVNTQPLPQRQPADEEND